MGEISGMDDKVNVSQSTSDCNRDFVYSSYMSIRDDAEFQLCSLTAGFILFILARCEQFVLFGIAGIY